MKKATRTHLILTTAIMLGALAAPAFAAEKCAKEPVTVGFLPKLDTDPYWQSRMPDWNKVKTPLLSAANWGGQGLHPRGNFEGFVRAASEQKWLEVHGIEHWTHFYTNYGLALQKKFFGPFRVSVMLDPNGSNTTAAAGVALLAKTTKLKGKKAIVLAGTGPVGMRAAALLAQEGADVTLTSRSTERAAPTSSSTPRGPRCATCGASATTRTTSLPRKSSSRPPARSSRGSRYSFSRCRSPRRRPRAR